MKLILILLSLSMIWRGSCTDECGEFSLKNTISWVCAFVAWGVTLFGNVVG